MSRSDIDRRRRRAVEVGRGRDGGAVSPGTSWGSTCLMKPPPSTSPARPGPVDRRVTTGVDLVTRDARVYTCVSRLAVVLLRRNCVVFEAFSSQTTSLQNTTYSLKLSSKNNT